MFQRLFSSLNEENMIVQNANASLPQLEISERKCDLPFFFCEHLWVGKHLIRVAWNKQKFSENSRIINQYKSVISIQ